MSGESDGFLADAFHQVAVGGEHVGVVIDDVAAEFRRHVAFRQRHTDCGGNALTERTGSGLDAWRDEVFRMARGQRTELTEILDLLDGHRRIAGEIQQRVEQHRAVTGGEHEAVAVRPCRIAGVEFQELREQDRGDIRGTHRQAGVARLRLLDGIHGERANRIGHTGRIDTHTHGMAA